MKIQITENDIRNMVLESFKKVMKEGWKPINRHFTGPDGEDYVDYDGEEWDGNDDEEESDTYEVNVFLGHSELPYSDGRFFDITFKVDADGNVLGYTCNGDTNQREKTGYTCPKWLDKQIMDWANSPEGQAYIKDNML